MPDGRVIRNVPEGTTKAELNALLEARDARAAQEQNSNLPAPTGEAMPDRPEGSTGVMGLSNQVQAVGPAAVVSQPPQGANPEEWQKLSMEQKAAAKNQELVTRQSRYYDLFPEAKPSPYDPETGVRSYGPAQEEIPLVSARDMENLAPETQANVRQHSLQQTENKMRARGLDTRTKASKVSGNTITLLNIAPPPIAESQEEVESGKHQERYRDWINKMSISMKASLANDFGQEVLVEYDEDSGEFVYRNPETNKWTPVIARGMNTEDFSALIKDPQQTAILAGELVLATGLAIYTGGVGGILIGEGALGAAGAATSQYVRNKRAQELGFNVEGSEGVGQAAVVGGALGAVGGAATAAATKRAARKVAAERITGRDTNRARGITEAVEKGAKQRDQIDDLARDLEVAHANVGVGTRMGARTSPEKAAQAAKAQRQQQIDAGEKSLAAITSPNAAAKTPTPRATPGSTRPGLQDAEEGLVGAVRDSIETATKPGKVVVNDMRMSIRNALQTMRTAFKDKVRTSLEGAGQGLAVANRGYAQDQMNKLLGKRPGTKINDVEVELNLPTRHRVMRLRTTVNNIRDDLDGLNSTELDAMNEALSPFISRTRAGDDVIFNGGEVEHLIDTMNRLLYGRGDTVVGKEVREGILSLREDLIENYGNAARKFMPQEAGDTVKNVVRRWADSSEDFHKLQGGSLDVDEDMIERGLTNLQSYGAGPEVISEIMGEFATNEGSKAILTVLREVDDIIKALTDPDVGLTADQFADALLGRGTGNLSAGSARKMDDVFDVLGSQRSLMQARRKAGKEVKNTQLEDTLDRLVDSVKDEVSKAVHISMKGDPGKASSTLTEILSNPRVESLMGADYVSHLRGLRKYLRRYAIEAAKVNPQNITKTASAPVRTTLRRIGTVGGAVTALLGASSPMALVVGGGMGLGSRLLRTGRKVVDQKATDAVSRVLSDPDLFDDIRKISLARGESASTYAALAEALSKIYSERVGEDVEAIVLPDGSVLPLSPGLDTGAAVLEKGKEIQDRLRDEILETTAPHDEALRQRK
jgi:hypothetical protein